MPRLLAAVLLAAFAWSQALAADCPLAPGGQPAAGARAAQRAHAPDAMHAHHGHGPRGAPPEHHHAAECVLAMACGVAALPHRAAGSAVLAAPAADAAWPAAPPYLSPSLGSDPPPPRLA